MLLSLTVHHPPGMELVGGGLRLLIVVVYFKLVEDDLGEPSFLQTLWIMYDPRCLQLASYLEKL